MAKVKAKKLAQKRKQLLDIDKFRSFGRFSDIERNYRNHHQWQAALEAFSEAKYKESILSVLLYLKNVDNVNVQWEDTDQVLRFSVQQGSCLLHGYADQLIFKASAILGKANNLHVGFMRKLLERNFFLQHCRFGLSLTNEVQCIFDTPVSIASPYKIYHGLRELAVVADQEDDLLIDEFTEIQKIKPQKLPLPDAAKTARQIAFMRNKVRTLMEELETGGKVLHRNPGTIAYLALDLAYRLDYLLCPQGFTMKAIENIHRIFFQQDELSLERKVHLMLKELKQIEERSDEQLSGEFYMGTYTFGLASAAPSGIISTFIKSELPAIQWYISNNQKLAAAAVPGFIAGYLLYHYNLPGPVRYLLHLLYESTEPDLHQISDRYKAGESGFYGETNLEEKIKLSLKIDRDVYRDWSLPHLKINTDNPVLFTKTLLETIATMEIKYPDL